MNDILELILGTIPVFLMERGPFALAAAAGAYLFMTLFFALFLAYTAVNKARKSGDLDLVHPLVRSWCYAIVYFGLLLDVLFNITVGTVLFLEAPDIRRLTFTARVKKWKDRSGVRGVIALWLCFHLNIYEPGHC